MKYRVQWEAEVEAESPNHAAIKAQELQKRTILGTFEVLDKEGNKIKVNLDENKSHIHSEMYFG
jgi:hypothetical protein